MSSLKISLLVEAGKLAVSKSLLDAVCDTPINRLAKKLTAVNTPQPDSHISRISTMWTVLREAHGDGDRKHAAQALLVECYGPAVRRYLMALTRDEHLTDEIWQRFMVQLLEGGFRNANPENGKFRAYVKVTLFHLVARVRRERSRQPQRVDASSLPTESSDTSAMEDQFDVLWREQLLDRTWNALRDAQPRYYRLLKLRAEFPDLAIAELSERFDDPSAKTSAAIRKLLSRSRERFANLLLDEIVRSVEPPNAERVESELLDLGLMEYCRDVFQTRSREGD